MKKSQQSSKPDKERFDFKSIVEENKTFKVLGSDHLFYIDDLGGWYTFVNICFPSKFFLGMMNLEITMIKMPILAMVLVLQQNLPIQTDSKTLKNYKMA